MKANNKILFVLCLFFWIMAGISFACASEWIVNPASEVCFIENKGQFDAIGRKNEKILYGVTQGTTQIYFLKDGIIFRFDKREEKKDKHEQENKKEKDNKEYIFESESIRMKWQNINPDVQLVSEEPAAQIQNYCIKEKHYKQIAGVKCFHKLIYKNLYKGIDAEYIIDSRGGIKYSLNIQPDADIEKIKMRYEGMKQILPDEQGNIQLLSELGKIIDHAPVSFYADNHESIASYFSIEGNEISFTIPQKENNRPIVIDPWTQTVSTYPPDNKIYEIDIDSSGNIYVLGGGGQYSLYGNPFFISKYNSTGTLQWTYNFYASLHFNQFYDFIGEISVDGLGNVYATAFSFICKLNPSGNVLWADSIGTSYVYLEPWRVNYSCGQVMIGGGDPSNATGKAFGTLINSSNGNYPPNGSLPQLANTEIRSFTRSTNGNYYAILGKHQTNNSYPQEILAFNSSLSVLYNIQSGYNNTNYNGSAYSSTEYGWNHIASTDKYLYTMDGATLHKRDIANGSILLTTTIPNGTQYGNGGITVDECGYIYVGSKSKVHKFNPSLNLISTSNVSSDVYDLAISPLNKEVVVCGNGFIASLNMNANYPFSFKVCGQTAPDLSFTASANSICAGQSVTLSASGGTTYSWSTGATSGSIVISPTTTSNYTVSTTTGGCSLNATLTVTVNSVPSANAGNDITICSGNSTTLTASGGGNYSWNTNATTSSITVSPTANTTYTVTVSNACGSSNDDVNVAVITCSVNATCPQFQNPDFENGGVGGTAILPAPWTACNFTPDTYPGGPIATTLTPTSGQNFVGYFTQLTFGESFTEQLASPLLSGNSYAFTIDLACYLNAMMSMVAKGQFEIWGGTSACTKMQLLWTSPLITNPAWQNFTVNLATPSSNYSYLTFEAKCPTCAVGEQAYVFLDNIQCSSVSTPTVTTTGTTVCSGSCATLTASVSGGSSPFTYSWSTGATTSSIIVCPTTNTTYTLTITDANSATSSDTAIVAVQNCSGGGCPAFVNPDFEGAPPAIGAVPPSWVICGAGTPDICPQALVGASLPATSGSTYVGGTNLTPEMWGQQLSSPITAGNPYSFTMDMYAVNYPPLIIAGGQLEIWGGGNTSCAQAELLWTSPMLPSVNNWQTVNVNFTPTQNHTYILFKPIGSAGMNYICVDNIQCTSVSTPTVTTTGTTVCSGSCATLTASVSGGSSPFTYLWSTGATTSSIIVCPTTNTTYTLTITDANSATSSDTAIVAVQNCSGGCPAFQNPDFENGGTGGGNMLPPAWTICQNTPDTYPGGPITTTLTPQSGQNFVGIIESGGSSESFTQQLSTPLTINGNYSFPIELAGQNQPIMSFVLKGNLEIWGGTSACTKTQLLWTSPMITNTAWQTYTVNFASPAGAYTHLTFETKCPTCNVITESAYIFLDNIQCSVVTTPTITATGNQICSGDCITITSNISGGTSPFTYSWNPGGQTTSSIVICPTSNTTYSVTVTDANNNTAIDTAVVIVNAVPNASINGAGTICSGSSATLNASGGNNYSWNTTQTSSSIIVSPTSATTYSVIVSSGTCSDTASATVNVIATPTISVSPNTTVCSGDTIILSASGGNNYSWNTGATTSSISITNSCVGGTVTATYTVTASNGSCSNSATTTLTTFCPNALSLSGDTLLCLGDVSTLTASGGGNYSWSTGATNNPIVVSPSSNTTYTASLTDANGCSRTNTISITVSPPPTANISGNDTICTGSNTILTASGGGNYLWNTNSTSSAINVSTAGNYSVLVSVGSCTATANFVVTVVSNPTANAGTDIVINIGESTTLTASGGGTYSWSPSTGLSCTNCQNPIATPTATIDYCVFITNSNGCSDSDCVTITVEYNCTPLYVPNAFSPNDDNENDFFLIYGNCIKEMKLIIYNRWGEKVFETTDQKQGWDGIFRGNLEDSAVFTYYFEYTLLNGESGNRKGNISLLR